MKLFTMIALLFLAFVTPSCGLFQDEEETVEEATEEDIGSAIGDSTSKTKTGFFNYSMTLTPYSKGFKIRFDPKPQGNTYCTGVIYQNDQIFSYTAAETRSVYQSYDIYQGYFTRNYVGCTRTFDEWMDLNIVSSKAGFDPTKSYRVCHSGFGLFADCLDVNL